MALGRFGMMATFRLTQSSPRLRRVRLRAGGSSGVTCSSVDMPWCRWQPQVMAQPSVNDATRDSRRMILAISVGTFIHGYDNLLYGYFATVFAVLFFPPGNPTAGIINI